MIEGDEFTLEHWHSERFQEVITDLFRGRGRVLKRGAPEEAEFEGACVCAGKTAAGGIGC